MKKTLIVLAIVFMFGSTCFSAEDLQAKVKQQEIQLLKSQLNNINLELGYLQERAKNLVGQKQALQNQLKQKSDVLDSKNKK